MVSESTHDFGDVFEGREPATHRFRITNTSKVSLSLTPQVSVGPFLASVTADSIAPGESAELVCKPSTNSGMNGLRVATATVRFGDGKTGERQFALKANFIPQISLSEPAIRFPSNDVTSLLSLTISKDSNLRLFDVKSTSKSIRVKITETEETDRFLKYRLQFRLLDGEKEANPPGKVNIIFQSGSSTLQRELEFFRTRKNAETSSQLLDTR